MSLPHDIQEETAAEPIPEQKPTPYPEESIPRTSQEHNPIVTPEPTLTHLVSKTIWVQNRSSARWPRIWSRQKIKCLRQ